MSEYGSMQVSEGINVNKTNATKQWFIPAILMCICVYISVCLFVLLVGYWSSLAVAFITIKIKRYLLLVPYVSYILLYSHT